MDINTQGVVQAELSPGGFGKGEWEQISITDGRSKTRYVKVDWFPSTAKKNEFIEEAKERFYRESYTPDELRASLKAQEEQHAAKYLQNWDPDTSLYYGEKQNLTTELENLRLKYNSIVDDIAKIDAPITKKTIGQEDIIIPSQFGEAYTARGSRGLGTELNVRDVSNAGTYESQVTGYSAALMKDLEFTGQEPLPLTW